MRLEEQSDFWVVYTEEGDVKLRWLMIFNNLNFLLK